MADTILITGLPAVLEYAPPFVAMFGAAEGPVCVDFWVRAIERDVPRLRVTTAGMGDSRLLALAAAADTEDCGARNARTTIELEDVDDRERPVRLIIPARAFPHAESGASGKLVLLRERRVLADASISLRRQGRGPILSGAFWFAGIAIPALMTAGLGFWFYTRQKSVDARASEAAAFARFQKEDAEKLGNFFEGLYQTIAELESEREYTATMERELGARRILIALPRAQRERVLAALRNGERDKVSEELAKAFPDFERTIRGSPNQGR